ncbi:hypothetical protein ABIE44_003754 [Marmoricola sp. OAE513]|uniref:VanZ family protein n=1 Tax=Marmoricola sp. OAE513 TaxID=2817894 RepID=UPI001AE942EE
MHRTVAAVLLAAYAVVVARLTLADPSAGSWAFTAADRFATAATDGRLTWERTEVLANVALFVPAAFLLTLVTQRAWLSALLCLAASAGIEYVQLAYLPTRVSSGADVLHNAYGALLGAVLAWPIAALARNRSRRAAGRVDQDLGVRLGVLQGVERP